MVATRVPFGEAMQTTSSTVTAEGLRRMMDGLTTSFEPTIMRFVRAWRRDRSHGIGRVVMLALPPTAADVIDHLRTEHRVPYSFAAYMIAELVRRGRLQATPNGHPAFRDEPTYRRLTAVGLMAETGPRRCPTPPVWSSRLDGISRGTARVKLEMCDQ